MEDEWDMQHTGYDEYIKKITLQSSGKKNRTLKEKSYVRECFYTRTRYAPNFLSESIFHNTFHKGHCIVTQSLCPTDK
jgi:hypothetical protein